LGDGAGAAESAAGVDTPAGGVERAAASEVDCTSGDSGDAAGVEAEAGVGAVSNRRGRYQQRDAERGDTRACEHTGTKRDCGHGGGSLRDIENPRGAGSFVISTSPTRRPVRQRNRRGRARSRLRDAPHHFCVATAAAGYQTDASIIPEASASMSGQERDPVAVSRRICATADEIFTVLADPKRHLDLDGSGMLRGPVSDAVISAVGDVFVMRMHYSEHGDYEMNNHVVEFERPRRIGWEPEAGRGHPDESTSDARWGHRWIFDLVPDGAGATIVTEIYDCSRTSADESATIDDGRIWIEAMTQTLQRLDDICTRGRTDQE
jgi:hypothetical protein